MLVNRGKKFLRYVEGLPDFFGGDEVMNNTFKNALANRTVKLADGSVLQMRRGPIGRVVASVPGVPTTSERARENLYVSVDVYGGAGVKIGIYVSKLPAMASWRFVPCSVPATTYSSREEDEDHDARITGSGRLGAFVELKPNLWPDEFAALVASTMTPVFEVRYIVDSTEAWEGQQTIGALYSYGGSRHFITWYETGNRNLYVEAGSDYLALGSGRVLVHGLTGRTYGCTLRSGAFAAGEWRKDVDKSGVFPVTADNEWGYLQYTVTNAATGWAPGGTGVAFATGDMTSMLVCANEVSNEWTYDTTYPPEDAPADQWEYPQTRRVFIDFMGVTHALESLLVPVYAPTHFAVDTAPKYFRIEDVDRCLFSYKSRGTTPGLEGGYGITVGYCHGSELVRKDFTEIDATLGLPTVSLGSVGVGYLALNSVRMLTEKVLPGR